jgi:hypothetical protein
MYVYFVRETYVSKIRPSASDLQLFVVSKKDLARCISTMDDPYKQEDTDYDTATEDSDYDTATAY